MLRLRLEYGATETMKVLAKIPETSLWANRKCLLICATVAIANMQYGLDSAAIGSLQAMPGFLAVFGYRDPSQATGYAIEASRFFRRTFHSSS